MAEKSGGEKNPNSGRGHPNSDMGRGGKHRDQPKDAGKETKGVETGGDGSANTGQNSANAASSSASASSQHKTEVEETQIQNDGKGPSPERGGGVTANENTDKNVDTSRQVESERTAGVPKDKKRSDKVGEHHDRSESGAGNDSPVDLGQRDKEEVGSGSIKTDDEDKDTNSDKSKAPPGSGASGKNNDESDKSKAPPGSGASGKSNDESDKSKAPPGSGASGKSNDESDKSKAPPGLGASGKSNDESDKSKAPPGLGASGKSNDESDKSKAPPGSDASGKSNDKSDKFKAPAGSGQGKQGDASKKTSSRTSVRRPAPPPPPPPPPKPTNIKGKDAAGKPPENSSHPLSPEDTAHQTTGTSGTKVNPASGAPTKKAGNTNTKPPTNGKRKPVFGNAAAGSSPVDENPKDPLSSEDSTNQTSGTKSVSTLKETFENPSTRIKKDPPQEYSRAPRPPPIDLSGLNVPQQQGMAVTFHVYLPTDLWNYDGNTCRIDICFGHPKMGNWTPIGPLQCLGAVERNLSEFSGYLSIDAKILQGECCVPYKYLVNGTYEFLHGIISHGSDFINRCLQIPAQNFLYGGQFHQCDNIIYPEKLKGGSGRWSWNPFNLLSNSSSGPGVLSHDVVQQKLLPIYLRYYKHLLLKMEVDDINLNMEYIKSIFNKLESPKVHQGRRSRPCPAKGVSNAMLNWLLSVLKGLQKVSTYTVIDNGRRMVSVLSIILCFDFLFLQQVKVQDIQSEDIASMMSMLVLQPNLEQKMCHDLNIIISSCPEGVKKRLTDTIVLFCNELLRQRFLNRPIWLYAVPLIHFLQGDCQPFDKPQQNQGKIMWPISSPICLDLVRERTYSGRNKLIEEHYSGLEPLLQADSLLLPVVIYVCPRQQLTHLFKRIPLHVSASWASYLIKLNHQHYVDDVSLMIIEISQNKTKISKDLERPLLQATEMAVLQLLSDLLRNLSSNARDCHNTVITLISLVLHSSEVLKMAVKYRSGDHNFNTKLKAICNEITRWVKKEFKSPFEIQSEHVWGVPRLQEMRIWDKMLRLDCPQAAQPVWPNLIKEAIAERVDDVLPFYKMTLVYMLGVYKDAHPALEEIIITAALERLKVSVKNAEVVAGQLDKLHSQVANKRIVCTILTTILMNQYPSGPDGINGLELLKWSLWATYLKIHSSFKYYNNPPLSKEHRNLPLTSWAPPILNEEKLYSLCSQAVVILEQLYDEIVTGNITFKQLEYMESQKKQLNKLCIASNAARRQRYLSLPELDASINKYKAEYSELMRRIELLNTLFSRVLTYLKIEGIEDLLEKLNANYEDVYIRVLLSTGGADVSLFELLEITRPLESMLYSYVVISKKHANGIFDRVWNERITDVVAAGSVSVSDITSKLWQPTVTKCTDLLTTLQKRTMTLSVVDQYFQPYFNNKEAALNDMINLFNGLRHHVKTFGEPKMEERRIREAVDVVQQYWSLRTYSDAAKICLELKEKLKLTGNFDIVNVLASQDTASMKGQSLDEIDNTLISTGKFLQEFASEEKLSCLRTYSKCLDVVNWLKKNTKDVNELQSFVTVALNNAATGEDTLTNAKLSSLRAVGSGFGFLIYELRSDADFDTLVKGCRFVWEAMQRTPNLPQYLEDCSSELQWFKEVKAQQGSVKETSFGQMDACIKLGKYRVGESGDKIFTKVNDIVTLTVETEHTRRYTLDELKDLESKLVLITGSRDYKREKVDGFLDTFHSVCEIAEVLIALQQVGNVKYVGWYITVPCKAEIIPDVRKLHNLMTSELKDWMEEVRAARHDHYELNYYTTPQLLTLRRVLGYLKSLGTKASFDSSNAHILALLQSVVPDINIHSVTNALESAVGENAVSGDRQIEVQPVPREERKADGSVEEEAVADTSQHETISALEKLSGKQRDIFHYIVRIYGETRSHIVLKAFEDGEEDQSEIENLVMEYDVEMAQESEEDSSEDEEDMDTSPPVATELIDARAHIRSKKYEPKSGKSLEYDETQLMTTKEAVDASHTAVRELIEAGFGVTESISAIEKFGTPEEAIDYLTALRTQSFNTEPILISDGTEDATESIAEEATQTVKMCCYKKAVKSYLSISELGSVLRYLSSHSVIQQQKPQPRTFHLKLLKSGSPNLLVVPPDRVLRTALSLYMTPEDDSLPLPTFEEILICNVYTTSEEVELLWHRAVHDPGHRRIFCLVHAEKLPYQTCDQALRCLHESIEGEKGYRIVIICNSDEEDQSLMVTKLSQYRRPYLPPEDVTMYQEYLKSHFESPTMPDIDGLRSCVRVVSSNRAGMGKTHCIQNMASVLAEFRGTSTVRVAVPIHGPTLSVENLIKSLTEYGRNEQHCIMHLDIAPNVMWQLDTTLFSMLIQGGLCDQHGNVWRSDPTHTYAVEVTLTNKEMQLKEKNGSLLALLKLLPTVECLSPRKCLPLLNKENVTGKVLFDEALFKKPYFQRVYQYLRRHKAGQSLDSFLFSNSVEGNTSDCLKLILGYCGVEDPTWAEINHFIRFLDIQLNLCEKSIFCNRDFVGDVLDGFKNFVVKFMIRMSRDFATSSLQGEVAGDSVQTEGNNLQQYQIEERKLWEQSAHPYIFFNDDGMTLTFVGFMVSSKGDLINASKRILEQAIMSIQLKEALKPQGADFEDNYETWNKGKMISKIGTVMGLSQVHDPDPSYVLTVDNLIKILAIQMRFRCGIPVVLMGETGCGKTRLIRFMCDLASQNAGVKNMLILKVHGGTTETEVEEFVNTAQKLAQRNKKHGLKETVVFFDEANTTDAIGLIKEIMCDRSLYGKPVSEELKFIAACNPYKKHSDDMITKLETAGLGFFVHAEKTKQKLGKIPLRNLVYRVQDLPPSMRPLVYDFGQLNTAQEESYIKHIVSDHVKSKSSLSGCPQGTESIIAKVLSWSQKYMRERKDECSFVSLRDVERAMLVFEYFYDKMHLLSPLMDTCNDAGKIKPSSKDSEVKFLTRSLILALSVCYHARLQDRKVYEKGVSALFGHPLVLSDKEVEFQNEIRRCQEVLLDSMQLGKNIARNAALRENVFMMAICVDLRIPLFLVGKPGSSKSLAKSIVANSMNGKSSKTELLRSFKEVHMFSYQCSQLSTSQSIIKVFETAKSFQKENTSTFVSVVVLDEVGLAEDSPNLPLKALHPLLEDGTAGADRTNEGEEDQFDDEIIEREKRVAFIGISNWALDPAKMNRGVMVTRGDPDINELELSARGICSTKEEDQVRDHLQKYFKPLAEAYDAICKKQKRQFFGLRDFYSLIKMLYWICENSHLPPTGPQLRHAIMRNFGGMQEFSPYEEFKIQFRTTLSRAEAVHTKYYDQQNPDCSSHGLIRASLRTKDTSWHGENRYLLFLTENYAALEVLKHYIHDPQSTKELMSTEEQNPSQSVDLSPWEMEPFVLFGSSFPKDTEYTQVCRNINQIKICMETGRMVVLLNLHNLYESLYDLLNQYYIRYGEERYVDLGLQTHKLKCKVHKEFKLIMIAEKATVYEKFPTPLINRLEKHFVLVSSILTDKEALMVKKLQRWICKFSTVNSSVFQEKDAFIGYREDTPAAVVFQANHQLQKLVQNTDRQSPEWKRFEQVGIFDEELVSSLVNSDGSDESEYWILAVLELCKYLLLYTSSPAALVRLANTSLSSNFSHFCDLYKSQHHSSISDFLKYHIQSFWSSESRVGLLMQVTTHSHLLSYDEVDKVENALEYEVGSILSFLLHDFDTELHFSSRVGPLFKKTKDRNCRLIIIQCDMGYTTDDLIACARHRIYDMRAKAARELTETEAVGTHVLFVVHLPVQTMQSSLVGFQGEPWISAHIDEIRPTSEGNITLDIAQGISISKLFYGPLDDKTIEQVIETKQTLSPEEGISEDEPTEQVISLLSDASKGPSTQVCDSVAGPSGQVLSQASGPSEQLLSPTLGPTHKLVSTVTSPDVQVTTSIAAPTAQVIPSETGPVTQVITSVSEIPQATQKISRTIVVIPAMYTQCRRLHICIQAAASRLIQFTPNKRWATKRIELLTKLIPGETQFPIDERSFYGTVVKHIHGLLKQRDVTYGPKSNWVLTEAMNLRKLHMGGTFKNALAKKVDEVVIPLFAELIAIIDSNQNLNHLKDLGKKQCSVHDLWLQIFSSPSVLDLDYEQIVGREKVPVADDNFQCEFPFSWIVKEAIDNQWESTRNTAGPLEEVYQKMCSVFSETPVGELLDNFSIESETADYDDLLQRYVGDFLQTSFRGGHTDITRTSSQYKLLYTVLTHLSKKSSFVQKHATEEGRKTLSHQIVAVHVVYHSVEEQIHWFGQLTLCMPGILQHLQGLPHDSSEMILHLQALQTVLEILKPKVREKEAEVKQWLNHITVCRNAIDSILISSSDHHLVKQARSDWQRIRVLQIFVEHVVMKYDGMGKYANRLQLHMKKGADFSKSETMKRLRTFLKAVTKELKDQYKTKETKSLLQAIMKSCDEFLIEVVSALCFGQETVPENDLIEMLLNFIFTEEAEAEGARPTTRQMTLHRQKRDETPVIRSYLLQLLLGRNFEQLRKHLQDFFEKSQRALTPELNTELLLMCTQCFEDALVKRYASLSWEEQLSVCVDLLEARDNLIITTDTEMSLQYLEAIANMRYALVVVAELLHKNPNMPIAHQLLEISTKQVVKEDSMDISQESESEDMSVEREEDKTKEQLMDISEMEPKKDVVDIGEESKAILEAVLQSPEGASASIIEQDPATQLNITDTEEEGIVEDVAFPEAISESPEGGTHMPLSVEANVNLMSTETYEMTPAKPAKRIQTKSTVTEEDPAVQLLHAASSLCRGSSTTGPLHYLIKQIVRQFGFSFLRKIAKAQPWIIPEGLSWTEEVDNTSDIFVIYGKPYTDIRVTVGAAVYGQNYTALSDTTKEMQLQDCGLLLLSLYQLGYKSSVKEALAQTLSTKTLQKFSTAIQGSKTLPEEIKVAAKLLLNRQEGPLAAMTSIPPTLVDSHTAMAIVAHTVAATLCRQKADLLLPFKTMLNDPSSLAKCYLPTMPEGITQENMIAIAESGQIYECTNGHPIFVNECQKVISAVCTACYAPMNIGSTTLNLKDHTVYQGHCLGSPVARNSVPSSVRSLSPAACAILRAIMHSALLWATCNGKIPVQNMKELVKIEKFENGEVSQFFHCHLEKDVQVLAKAIGRNEDEAAIVIHLVLRQVLMSEPQTTGVMKTIAALKTPHYRDEWEKRFNDTYIQPILENIHKEIRGAMKCTFEDSKEEHDPLLYMVYEQGDASEDGYLWSYRSRITLEHLAIELQPHQQKYPILTQFLELEPVLRATPYLSDIVKLQRSLYKVFHHRISVQESQEKTIGEFIEEKHLPKSMLQSFASAWSLVKDKLRDHARVKVEQRFLDELQNISESTSLQYLIPTTIGPGACSFALVDYLVLQHNSFIEMCQGVVDGDDRSKSIRIWKAHRVPLPLIHRCHLLDYEQQLLSIVLSHCHYSLCVGQGQDVKYDLAALEKHIFDRFIQGKPKILSFMVDVSYTKDAYTATNFTAVRTKCRDQVELPTKVQQDILSELIEIDQISDALNVVNIVLRLLASGGGRSTTRLDHYLRKLQMDEKSYSKMAEHCRLEHIISLWKTLSVGLGKKMIKKRQEPFEVDGSLQKGLGKSDKQAINIYLSGFSDLDNLLGTLCEFIEFVESDLKHTISLQEKWTLQETLKAFMERNQQEVPQHITDFPTSIQLSQTVATWKHIVAFQEAKQNLL